MRNTIKLIIPYFGKWPEWFELYLESLANNPMVHFHFYTDCKIPINPPSNCIFTSISFNAYVENAKKQIGTEINIPNPYKICDLRPFFGIIHKEDIANYDFFGWTDVDLLFGDIRSFYTDEILNEHDAISSHSDRLSGHLALLRNTNEMRSIGYRIYAWKEALNNPVFIGIDEHGITNALTMTFWDKVSEKFGLPLHFFPFSLVKKRKLKRYYFVEQYSTPFLPKPWIDGSINSRQPENWTYKNGVIRNTRDGERNFMYLHFMNFKSSQWRHDGTKAPWEGKACCFATLEEMRNSGLRIDPSGINALL
jgi:hypothetical protein